MNLPILPGYEVSLFAGICDFVKEHERWEFVYNSEFNAAAVSALKTIEWDGAIVRITDPRIRKFVKRLGKPVVNVSAWIEDSHLPTVRRDEWRGGELAAQYLQTKGLTRFAFMRCRGKGWFHSARFDGYAETLRKANFECDVYDQRCSLNHKEESKRFSDWLMSLQPPFGLFLSDDFEAQAVTMACSKAGYSIPRDIALLGSINQPDVIKHSVPTLSSVNPDEVTVGYTAAEKLCSLMNGAEIVPEIITIPPLPVVERQSTQISAIDDEEIRLAIEFIREHFSRPFSILEISEHLSISRATFYRRFLSVVGETPHSYIQKLRVDKARELLKSNKLLPLEDIASASGFSNRKHFNTAFIKQMGKSPSQWRAKLARNGAVDMA
ncbi:MAG: substrate-binding domain-containing protein [Verrucomicrobiota bacterium]